MKFIALITSILFSFSALADAGSQLAFEKRLNEYQFAVTTEWDQKDQAALARINRAFEAEVKSLVHLTESDVLSVLEKKALSKSHLEALKLRLSIARASGNPDAEFAVVQDELKRSFHQGASWNGETTVMYLSMALLFAGFIAIAMATTQDSECLEEAEYIDCDNSGNDCYPVTLCKTYDH